MKRLVFCLLWLCGTMPIWAQTQTMPPASVSNEDYQRIELARVRERENLDAQEAACYQRFAVNDCLKKVQSKRIAVMAELKRQEGLLHDRERAQQGAEALERIEQKVLERQQRLDEDQTEGGTKRVQQKLQEQIDKRVEHAAKAASGPAPVSQQAPAGPSAGEQAQARASYDRKQADAEKKRQEILKRQSEKIGKPANPLPNPP
jgi:hypothetical protein